jgi:hypothetical protein
VYRQTFTTPVTAGLAVLLGLLGVRVTWGMRQGE